MKTILAPVELSSGNQHVPAGSAVTATHAVRIPIDGLTLAAELTIPPQAQGIVLLADGSVNSRTAPPNRAVAIELNRAGIATLWFDLLTPAEENKDLRTGYWRYDVELLTHRLLQATKWVQEQPETRNLAIGYFATSTGTAAALIAAAGLGDAIQAVVSRGGRPDFAGEALGKVSAPTLLIVGEGDRGVLSLNRGAFARMACSKELTVVPCGDVLLEESDAKKRVASLAAAWFQNHLKAGVPLETDRGNAPL